MNFDGLLCHSRLQTYKVTSAGIKAVEREQEE
jgi:hypothetical protein